MSLGSAAQRTPPREHMSSPGTIQGSAKHNAKENVSSSPRQHNTLTSDRESISRLGAQPALGFIVKTSSWLSESHGLYDFESRNVSAKTYRCYGRHGQYRVLRRGSDVSLVSEKLARDILGADSSVQTIVKIGERNEKYHRRQGYVLTGGSEAEDARIFAERQLIMNSADNDNGPGDTANTKNKYKNNNYKTTENHLKTSSIPGNVLASGRHRAASSHVPGSCSRPPRPPSSVNFSNNNNITNGTQGINNAAVQDGEDGADSAESRALWIVNRSLKDGLLPLKVGNRIRLGRFSFKVKEIVCNEAEATKKLNRLPQDSDDELEASSKGNVRFVPHLPCSLSVRGSRSSPDYLLLSSPPQSPPEGQIAGVNTEAEGDEVPDETDRDYPADSARDCTEDPDNILPWILRKNSSLYSGSRPTIVLDRYQSSSKGSPTELRPSSSSLAGQQTGSSPIDRMDSCPSRESSMRTLASELVCDQMNANDENEDDVNENVADIESPSNTKVCRVCLCEEDAEEDERDGQGLLINPVVSACKCAGSMRWIHLDCLRTWMRGRLNIKEDGQSTCFFWRPLECELCKEPYPMYVDLKHPDSILSKQLAEAFLGPKDKRRKISEVKVTDVDSTLSLKPVELFSLPRPRWPYIVLEIKHESMNGQTGYHFVSFADSKNASLGRGHEVDVRVSDISVSRIHANLRYNSQPDALLNVLRECPYQMYVRKSRHSNQNEVCDCLGQLHHPDGLLGPYFFIEDLRSKFGTLVSVQEPIFMGARMTLSLQVGRTVLTFCMRRPSWNRFIPSVFHLRHHTAKLRSRKSLTDLASSGMLHQEESSDVKLLETFVPFGVSATQVNVTTNGRRDSAAGSLEEDINVVNNDNNNNNNN